MAPLPEKSYYPRGSSADDAKLVLSKLVDSSSKVAAQLYIVEMRNYPDNRLTPDFITKSWFPLLDDVREEWQQDADGNLEGGVGTGAAALIITGEQKAHKFFSNGLDLEVAMSTPNFFRDMYHAVLGRILTFPIPTVAAINGHAFAGGMVLSMACDFRVMKGAEAKGRAMMCMNEIDFGAPIPPPMLNLLAAKVSTPALLRQVALLGHRFTPAELLQHGMIDASAPTGETTIESAIKLGATVAPKASKGAWGPMKEAMYVKELDIIRTWDGFVDAEQPKAKL